MLWRLSVGIDEKNEKIARKKKLMLPKLSFVGHTIFKCLKLYKTQIKSNMIYIYEYVPMYNVHKY